MIKSVVPILVALAIAFGGGGLSVWYALKTQGGVGAVTIGQWTAFPDFGTPDADPYSQARVARESILALGKAEGLSFVADKDTDGQPLRRECQYTIDGLYPAARFWTLYAADENSTIVDTSKPRRAALHSYEIVRRPDNSAAISVGNHPAPGNWLPIQGAGALSFVLTFYDTPISGSTGLSDIDLPSIRRATCDA